MNVKSETVQEKFFAEVIDSNRYNPVVVSLIDKEPSEEVKAIYERAADKPIDD